MDFPTIFLEPCVTIHTYSLECVGPIITSSSSGTKFQSAVSAVYPVANTALFFPFFLGKPITALKMFWFNGAVVSGNVDAGIYTLDGTLLVSTGSTAQAAITSLQSVAITPTKLGPGLFYLAISMDNITGSLRRGLSGAAERLGAAEMVTAFALPGVATLGTLTSDYIPIFGLSTRSLI
jgi:hypothetical protein